MIVKLHPRVYTVTFTAEEAELISTLVDGRFIWGREGERQYDDNQLKAIQGVVGKVNGYYPKHKLASLIYNVIEHALCPQFGTEDGLDEGRGTFDSSKD